MNKSKLVLTSSYQLFLSTRSRLANA